jgi:hypothetical protein
MALSPRELIQQQIRRKAAKTKETREKHAGRISVEDVVFSFLRDFDSSYKDAATDVEKAMLIEAESMRLLYNLQMIDREVKLELVWFGDAESGMNAIRLEGVKIIWSDAYRATNSLDSSEQLFDLCELLFR